MKPIKFIVQLNRIQSTTDGGGRIILDFGQDSTLSAQELLKLHLEGNLNFACVLVPYTDKDDQVGLYDKQSF